MQTNMDINVENSRLKNTLSEERKKLKEQFLRENLEGVENLKVADKRKINEESLNGDKRLRIDREGDEDVSSEPIKNLSSRRSSNLFRSCAPGNLKDTFPYEIDGENYTSVCDFCRQPLKKADVSRFYASDFLTSKKESSILKNEELNILPEDEKVQVKLTAFNVYDEAGHLCPFDNDYIEEGVTLYAAGYVKAIHCENSDIAGGVPIRRIGPISAWWIAGFDGGEQAVIGISTEIADYYLMKPSEKYEPFLRDMHQKMYLVKLLIEFLQKSDECEATYENLLYKLENTVPPSGFKSLSEENLLIYANYIYDLVISYDSSADSAERSLVNTPCMRHLAELAGISSEERLHRIRRKKKTSWVKRNNEMTKVATTNLVENIFESFFPDQMDRSCNDSFMLNKCFVLLDKYEYDDENESKIIIDEEDICDTTNAPENISTASFRECSVVLERIDIDSYNNSKQRTETSYDLGMPFSIVLETLSDEIIEKYSRKDEKDIRSCGISKKKKYALRNSNHVDVVVRWIGEPSIVEKDRRYFRSASVSSLEIAVNDFVVVDGDNSLNTIDRIGRVMYMWEEKNRKKFHINWMIRSTNTILGETGNPQELFETYDCDDLFLSEIIDRVKVTYLSIPCTTWLTLGNISLNEWYTSCNFKDEKSYYFQKRYDSTYGRFEDIKLEISENENFNACPFCELINQKNNSEKPAVAEELEFISTTNEYSYGVVRWRNEEFRVGSCVFLKPGTLFPILNKNYNESIKLENLDEERYPEMYRKQLERCRTEEIAEPFNIGYIVSIHSKKNARSASDILLSVKKLYRPQDTHLNEDTIRHLDLNLLYWSEEESVVSFTEVEGKCYVANEKNLSYSTDKWSKEGPYRFYYKEAYNCKDKSFHCAPTTIARQNEKVVTRRKSCIIEKIIEETPITWPTKTKPLRSLDIFAGCGGLTEGLHQAGIAECQWAIEKEDSAAHSFRLNYPQASVFTEDCNELLKVMMNGQLKKNGQHLPRKGEVELLCGGPPCQGFSGMNRFNHLQYSSFKNSLVVSFLSYVDFFRPRYVIMENVRNFLTFKKSMVLKLTIRCLIKMGYQCASGIVQAGNYGVPQSRRRAIILAAAPGEVLPDFPEPIHVFTSGLNSFGIDDKRFTINTKWVSSAPLRMLTVYDAISDLPEIKSGDVSQFEPQKCKPKTHFQRLIRSSSSNDLEMLKNHVSKPLNLLVEKRISFIPRTPGSDWRDLPNIELKLSNGSKIKKLIYTHHDIKNGKSKKGHLRGVCCCASGKKCQPKHKQNDTLIPWCLPHTANRHGNWSGLYGRIEWNKYFRTVTTQPEPMGKQGKVLHPEENRVISVRETARSQGFPDSFRFFGTTSDKYRQIGNAVPPPLALALGREILKAAVKREDETF